MNSTFSTVEISPEGLPVFRGTDYTLNKLLLSLADGKSFGHEARQHSLDKNDVRKFLKELSAFFSNASNFRGA